MGFSGLCIDLMTSFDVDRHGAPVIQQICQQNEKLRLQTNFPS